VLADASFAIAHTLLKLASVAWVYLLRFGWLCYTQSLGFEVPPIFWPFVFWPFVFWGGVDPWMFSYVLHLIQKWSSSSFSGKLKCLKPYVLGVLKWSFNTIKWIPINLISYKGLRIMYS